MPVLAGTIGSDLIKRVSSLMHVFCQLFSLVMFLSICLWLSLSLSFSLSLSLSLSLSSPPPPLARYKIIRHRVVSIMSQWVTVKMSPQLRSSLYSVLVPLLARNEDLAVRSILIPFRSPWTGYFPCDRFV